MILPRARPQFVTHNPFSQQSYCDLCSVTTGTLESENQESSVISARPLWLNTSVKSVVVSSNHALSLSVKCVTFSTSRELKSAASENVIVLRKSTSRGGGKLKGLKALKVTAQVKLKQKTAERRKWPWCNNNFYKNVYPHLISWVFVSEVTFYIFKQSKVFEYSWGWDENWGQMSMDELCRRCTVASW